MKDTGRADFLRDQARLQAWDAERSKKASQAKQEARTAPEAQEVATDSTQTDSEAQA